MDRAAQPPNQIIIKDPSLLQKPARPYADLPGGHSEGYDDTFKQVFRRFYAVDCGPVGAEPEYPQFADGLRQFTILEKELKSSRIMAGWKRRPGCSLGIRQFSYLAQTSAWLQWLVVVSVILESPG